MLFKYLYSLSSVFHGIGSSLTNSIDKCNSILVFQPEQSEYLTDIFVTGISTLPLVQVNQDQE